MRAPPRTFGQLSVVIPFIVAIASAAEPADFRPVPTSSSFPAAGRSAGARPCLAIPRARFTCFRAGRIRCRFSTRLEAIFAPGATRRSAWPTDCASTERAISGSLTLATIASSNSIARASCVGAGHRQGRYGQRSIRPADRCRFWSRWRVLCLGRLRQQPRDEVFAQRRAHQIMGHARQG